MANITIYTMSDGTDIQLKLDAQGIVNLEEKLGDSIQKKLSEIEKLSVASEYVAAASDKATAFAIYNDIIERGQTLEDYHKLIYKLLVSGGFLKAAEVERQVELTAAAEKMQEIAFNVQMKNIETKTAELQAAEKPKKKTAAKKN